MLETLAGIDGNTLRVATSGSAVCFPGAMTEANGWTLPVPGPGATAFTVEDMKGCYVFLLDDRGHIMPGQHLLAAVLTTTGEIAPTSYDLSECAMQPGNTVHVVFGEGVPPFQRLSDQERPFYDVSMIPTPETPSEASGSESEKNARTLTTSAMNDEDTKSITGVTSQTGTGQATVASNITNQLAFPIADVQPPFLTNEDCKQIRDAEKENMPCRTACLRVR